MAVAVKVGPWGVEGGQPLDIEKASKPQSLVSIGISSSAQSQDGRIFSISFVYQDQNKKNIVVSPWGKTDPDHPVETITMDPDEHLVKVIGTSTDLAGITSLRLETNKRPYGPYGYPAGGPFVLTLDPHAEVVAFFGSSSGDTLTALGVYVLGKKDLPIKIGTWGGGDAGEPVDVPTTPVKLKALTVYSTQSRGERIKGFSFVHQEKYGKLTTVGPWGTTNGPENPQFLLNPDDYVNNVSGTYDDYGVTSLKFTTHKKIQHGPYGYASGTAFSVPLPDDRDGNGAVLGFFGRASADSLVALGVYVGLVP